MFRAELVKRVPSVPEKFANCKQTHAQRERNDAHDEDEIPATFATDAILVPISDVFGQVSSKFRDRRDTDSSFKEARSATAQSLL